MGQMMNQPLLISTILEFAARHYGGSEIVSRRWRAICTATPTATATTRASAGQCLARPRRGHGRRVATLAWNGYRHLEAYYAVSGSGAVLHDQPAPASEQIAYI
jgi:fatty-acyl-CoA synthase